MPYSINKLYQSSSSIQLKKGLLNTLQTILEVPDNPNQDNPHYIQNNKKKYSIIVEKQQTYLLIRQNDVIWQIPMET